MNVQDLIEILIKIDCALPIVIEDKQGMEEATHVSVFRNVNGKVVAQIE